MEKYKIKTQIVSEKRGNLNYDIYYPVIEQPATTAAGSINNFSKFAASEFEKFIHSGIVPAARGKNEDFSVARIYRLMYSSRFVISYKYETSSYDKDMNRIYLVSGATWNVYTGSLIRLGDFFRQNVKYREMILYILESRIREKAVKGEKFFDDWKSRLYMSFKTGNYYLCPEGFVFYFDCGTLSASETKPREFLITFRELKNQIKTGL